MGECGVREIKFRAWDKKHNEMVPWDSIKRTGVLGTLANNQNRQISNVKLMQYTGLKDKNGVEIYEGDILRLKNRVTSDSKIWRDSISSVFFKNGMFVVDDDYPSLIDYSMVEVIGNIYQNPELLS
jgi:uncharacterized phage protein (TIGR01671 family)